MNRRHVFRVIAVALFLPLICGNRVPPKWQGFHKLSLAATERCVAKRLANFGSVRTERGEQPEAGKVRLFVARSPGRERRSLATVYLDGDAAFSAVWMDASTDKLGNRIWRDLKPSCRLI
jgi:hypothetical protein